MIELWRWLLCDVISYAPYSLQQLSDIIQADLCVVGISLHIIYLESQLLNLILNISKKNTILQRKIFAQQILLKCGIFMLIIVDLWQPVSLYLILVFRFYIIFSL